jgi:hypothetical protein
MTATGAQAVCGSSAMLKREVVPLPAVAIRRYEEHRRSPIFNVIAEHAPTQSTRLDRRHSRDAALA